MLRAVLFRALGLLFAFAVMISVSIRALLKGTFKKMFVKTVRTTRPAILGSFGTHRYLSLPKAGIRIHVVDSGSEGDSRPLMLFVHGFPDFWFSFRYQMKHFSSKFRCVAMDNRGYNKSDKPLNIQDYSIDKLASDVKEVVEALGHKKCILVGHDWGGAIGYQVCHRYPENISLYFALNIPHGSAFMDTIKNNWSQRLASWYMLYFQCPYIPEFMINSFDMKNWDAIYQKIPNETEEERQRDLDAYKYVFSQPDALRGPLNYYRSFIQFPVEQPKVLDRIKVPVCSIYGNADKALLREGILGSAKYIEDFTLKELDGIPHWVHLQANKEVIQCMEEYLQAKAEYI